MKYLFTILSILILLAGSVNAGEFYAGYNVHIIELTSRQPTVGILIGDAFKLGVELIGDTKAIHGIYETPGTSFVGLGGGYVDHHRQLDGHWQFTVTAGVHLKNLTFRWIHHSNGADFLRNDNRDARDRNIGMNLFTLGLHF